MFVLFPNGEAPSAPAEPKAHVPHKAFRHRGRGTATLHDPGKSLEEAFGIVGLGGSGRGMRMPSPSVASWNSSGSMSLTTAVWTLALIIMMSMTA